MENEQERLGRLYAQMSLGELQALAAAPDELTDAGRQALSTEMRRRGLALGASGVSQRDQNDRLDTSPRPVSEEPEREDVFTVGIPGVVPTGVAAMEQALEPGGEERSGMARLILFYDGIELARACDVLEQAGVGLAIERSLSPHFELWVEIGQQEQARAALRAKMQLFPLPEEPGPAADGYDGVVGVFPARTEAEEVRGMLERAGFRARVEEQEEEIGFGVVVDPEDQEQALALVAKGLGVE